MKRTLLVFASIGFALSILAVLEGAVRLLDLDRAVIAARPFPQEQLGMFRRDPELFWSMHPHLDMPFKGARVVTNSLGLRSGEIGAKPPGELRILSLGESTTFGTGVENDETYSALLAGLLLESAPRLTRVTAINAGVAAYSSFQSLVYLETRGLALEPDVVLFYHELNDYLPSAHRGSGNAESDLVRTDRQLYESRRNRLGRALHRRSALSRFAINAIARARLRSFDSYQLDPMLEIALRGIHSGPLVFTLEEGAPRRVELEENAMPRRVSEQERLQILEELLAICRDANIALVVIHPAYRGSQRHECVLTGFCHARGVPMFEAFDVLHAEGRPAGALYLDKAHPTREGHRRLATGLVRTLGETLEPGSGSRKSH